MIYRAPLLDPETKTLSNDHYKVMTCAQWWKFAEWSLQTGKNVQTLLEEFNPIAEEESPETIRLCGILPTCGLPGCLDSDGSVHT